MIQGVLKVVLRTGLNAYRETSGGSQFVTSSLFLCYELSKIRSTSCTNLIFSVTFTKACPIPIQNNMHWSWIEIKEIPKFKLYDNIRDLPKTTFWYHSNDTKRTLGLCCAHVAQLMTHPAIYTLPFTLQLCCKPLDILQRVTKSQKIHISSHVKLQKLHNINFPGHRSWGFSEMVEKQKFPPSLVTFLKNNQKPFPWNLGVNIPY